MNLRTYFIKQILFILLITNCPLLKILSQVPTPADWKQPGLFFGVNVGIAKNQVLVKGSQHVSINEVINENSLIASLGVGYFFSEYFGLTTGIGYTQLHSNSFIDTYQNQFNSIDVENDPYEMRVSGFDIEEQQKFHFVSIPFSVNMRLPFRKKMAIFFQPGINLLVPFNDSYVSSGTYTYQGYFPDYNVLLENLPDYGFSNDLEIQSEGELELKPLIVGAIGSVGFDYLVHKSIQLHIVAYYNRSLSGIIQNSVPDEFILTENPEQINSILGDSEKLTLQSYGLMIGIRYYLNGNTNSNNYSNSSIKKNQRIYKRQRKRYLR